MEKRIGSLGRVEPELVGAGPLVAEVTDRERPRFQDIERCMRSVGFREEEELANPGTGLSRPSASSAEEYGFAAFAVGVDILAKELISDREETCELAPL